MNHTAAKPRRGERAQAGHGTPKGWNPCKCRRRGTVPKARQNNLPPLRGWNMAAPPLQGFHPFGIPPPACALIIPSGFCDPEKRRVPDPDTTLQHCGREYPIRELRPATLRQGVPDPGTPPRNPAAGSTRPGNYASQTRGKEYPTRELRPATPRQGAPDPRTAPRRTERTVNMLNN